MGSESLDVNETRDMLVSIAKGMIASKDLLTAADQKIGDGDHGIGMARGFSAVEQLLEEGDFNRLDQLFKDVGRAILSATGGAAGAVFGTWFRAGGKALAGLDRFDSEALSLFLKNGLDAIKARGGAEAGDKTMVDVLEPASDAAASQCREPLSTCLDKVLDTAQIGVEETKSMVARHGKAKTLGERSIGYADPGAISTYMILSFMKDYLESVN